MLAPALRVTVAAVALTAPLFLASAQAAEPRRLAQAESGDSGELGPPVQLTPPPTDGSSGVEGQAFGQGGLNRGSFGQGIGGQQPGVTEDSPRQGIEIDRLGSRGLAFVGLLDEAHGGYSADLWIGSEQETLAGLFARLPERFSSPALHKIGMRLLLTRGVAPRHRSQRDTALDLSILENRAGALLDLGVFDGLNRLIDNVPGELPSERLARIEVQSLLLSGARAPACNSVRNAVSEYDAPFWTEAAVYCQLADGRVQEAELGISLLRETGESGHFLQAAQALAANGGESAAGDSSAPADLAMMLALDGQANLEALEGGNTATAVALCRGGSDLILRTAACEQAVQRGAAGGEALRELYMAHSFSKDLLTEAPSRAASLEPPRGRALLYQAAQRESVATARAELLRIGLERSHEAGLFLAAVRAYASLIGEVAPAPELLWFAAPAGRALYAAGRWEAATAWLTLARQEAIMNAQAASSFMALWPYAQMAGGQALTLDGSLAAWRSSQENTRDHRSIEKLARLRAIFHGLGIADDLSWGRLAADLPGEEEAAPPASYLYALWDARDSGRLGESLLLLLVLLGDDGPAGSHDLALNTALDTLMRFGLEQEARQLAIEAAVAAGI